MKPDHPQQGKLFERLRQPVRIAESVVRERQVLPEWIRPAEVISVLRINVALSTVYRWADEGVIVASKVRGVILIQTSSVFAAIEQGILTYNAIDLSPPTGDIPDPSGGLP